MTVHTRRSVLRSTAALTAALAVGTLAARSGSAQTRTKITYWAWTEHVSAANEVKAEFEAQNPDIGVEITSLNPFDLQDKFLVAMAAGTGGPDVGLILARRFENYIATGGLLDTTDALAGHKDQYPASVWSVIERDGVTHAVPYDQNPSVVFYRADVFEENGIETPIETWDDYVEAGRKIRAARDMFVTHVSSPSGVPGVANLAQYLQSRGVQVFDGEGQVVRNNELARDTLRFYFDLARTHGIAFESANNAPEFFRALKDNRIAGYTVPSWALFRLQTEAPEQSGMWRVMPWPKWGADAPATTGTWGGNVLAIPASTPNPEAALRWALFLGANERTQTQIWREGHLLPAFQPALQSDDLNEGEAYLGGQAIYPEALASREVNAFNYVDWAKAEVIMGNELDLMFGDQKGPEQAWDDIEEQLIRQLGR